MKSKLKQEQASNIDKAESQISANPNSDNVASYLNNLKNYKNDVFIPIPFRIVKKILRLDRNLRQYFNSYLKDNPIPNYITRIDAAVSFTHDKDLLAEKNKNISSIVLSENENGMTVPELLRNAKSKL